MANKTEKSALSLARALKRYYEDENPERAIASLWKEWPPAIAKIVDAVLWSPVAMRSEKEIVRDLRALNQRAHLKTTAAAPFRKS